MDAFAIINQWAELWFNTLLFLIIDSAFVFMVLGLIWLAIRKRCSVQVGYYLFLLVLLKLIVPSQFSLPSLFLDYTPKPIEIQEGERVAYPFDLTENSQNEKTTTIQDQSSPTVTKPSYESLSTQGYLFLN